MNIRPGIKKLLEEKISSKLQDIGLGSGLLNLMPKAKTTKAKINQWDDIKLKSFCTTKKTINEMKRQPTKWKKMFSNHISEELIMKIHKLLI